MKHCYPALKPHSLHTSHSSPFLFSLMHATCLPTTEHSPDAAHPTLSSPLHDRHGAGPGGEHR